MKTFKNFEKYIRKRPNNFVQDCRPLENAKVMAREKQSKATNVHGKEFIEEQFILSNLTVAVALALLSFI